MIINFKYLFTIIIFTSIINCKGQKEEIPDKSKVRLSNIEKKSNEIFIGKVFFSGDELKDYEFIKSDKTTIDSISYSIYKNIHNKKYVFSLERLLKTDDVEKYKIIDTVNIKKNVPINELKVEKSRIDNGVNLIYNQQLLKSWRFKINNQAQINWKGTYSVNIDYGKLDEFSEMTIDYDIEISNNKCIFSGMGYQTSFTDQCKIEEKGNRLILKYEKNIEGDGFSDHSKIDTLAILILKNNKYYIKSPIVANKNWNYNTELILNKK